MRKLMILTVLLLGCSNEVSSSSLEQFELEQSEQVELTAPEDQLLDSSPIGFYDDVSINTACVCEFETWQERGLLCLGLMCNEYCSDEVIACAERKQRCISHEW